MAMIFSLLFLTVNAYSQSHPTKEWLEKLGAKACNFTIRYEAETRSLHTVGYQVKVLPGWIMIYPCAGSTPKIIAIPSERVIQIEVN